MKTSGSDYEQLSTSTKQPGGRCCGVKCCCLAVLGVVLILFVGFGLFMAIGGACCFPIHASCSIDWVFEAECNQVNASLIHQIEAWRGDEGCRNGGQRCLYDVVEAGETLEATHETPVKHYVDRLTFTFTTQNKTCNVKGFSTAETWYAVLDKGTNYCNLHNLITGAGLDLLPGYQETTSNAQCTQYSSADCDVY